MVALGDPAEKSTWTLFDNGRRNLRQHLYRDAEACFVEYLNREPKAPKSAAKRARSHCYIAIAILARTQPLSWSSSEVDKVVARLHVAARLHNASHRPLANALARIVVETFYDTDDWNIPERLAELANKDDVDLLDSQDLDLLIEHLPGTFGPTWERIRRQAGLRNLDSAPPDPVDRGTPDPWRKVGVPRYFAIIPPEPPQPRFDRAWSLTGVGCLLAAAPLGGLFITTKWYVGVALTVLLLLTGLGLLFAGLLQFRECGRRRGLVRAREDAIRRSTPKPTDAQMDAWLMQDVDAAVRRGAGRHRLDLDDPASGLVITPQVVVGISRIPSRLAVEDILGKSGATAAKRMGYGRLPRAKSRVGADGRLRSSHYHILVVYMTKRRFGIYECDISLATREILAEGTQSFNYGDVVTMSSRKVTSVDDGKIPNVLIDSRGESRTVRGGSRFIMTLVNGHEIEVRTAVSESSGVDSAKAVAWRNESVQRSIERMVWALKDSEAG